MMPSPIGLIGIDRLVYVSEKGNLKPKLSESEMSPTCEFVGEQWRMSEYS